jgi:ADP-heptose:LPS heptosyltransferase
MKFFFERGAWASPEARKKISEKTAEEVKNIAVIRHAALGDMVLTRPFLLELRKHFPQATITLSLIRNYTYGAPEDLVDRIHLAYGYGKDQPKVSFFKQVRKMRELGYHDIIFDLAAVTRSVWTCILNPAWLKIGFPYHTSLGKWIYDAQVFRSDFKFEGEMLLDTLNLLGFRTAYPLNFHISADPMKRKMPYVIYFTGAADPKKQWPLSLFGQFIDKMTRAYPSFEHLVLEGVKPWEKLPEIMSGLPQIKNVILLKAQDLDETISLLKGACLVISNDTGMRNLAIATGTPTVGIFFITIPFRYWPRFGLHEIVYRSDGGIPTVNMVFEATQNIMKIVEINKVTNR